eukprot:9110652-Alexandrium_andersonii.AAC.1
MLLLCVQALMNWTNAWGLYKARRRKVQSAIRSRPVSTAICLNPKSAFPKMHSCFRRSTLELRGPRNGLKIGLSSSRA